MRQLVFLSIFLISNFQISCQNEKTQGNKAAKAVNEMKTTSINNAYKAKRPSGIIKFDLNGVNVATLQNQNQCMIIGMGNDYGQLMVSGGNLLTITYVGKPKLGVIEVNKIGDIPNLGFQIIEKGIIYNNMHGGSALVEISKMKKDGNNIYIAGKFSGTLKSQDGKKTISISNGIFKSDYVD